MVSIAVLTTAQTRGSHSLSAPAATAAVTEEWMVSISFANFIHFALLVELFYEYSILSLDFIPATQLRSSKCVCALCIEVDILYRHIICRDCKKPLALPLFTVSNNNNYILIFTCQCACQHTRNWLRLQCLRSQPMVWVRVCAVSFSRFSFVPFWYLHCRLCLLWQLKSQQRKMYNAENDILTN